MGWRGVTLGPSGGSRDLLQKGGPCLCAPADKAGKVVVLLMKKRKVGTNGYNVQNLTGKKKLTTERWRHDDRGECRIKLQGDEGRWGWGRSNMKESDREEIFWPKGVR